MSIFQGGEGMSVKLKKMTQDDFFAFCQWSIEDHAFELMEELQLPREDALKEAKSEFSSMLPRGLDTQNNQLLTIMAEEKNVGFLWTIYEQTAGRRQCFLCDLAIWEAYRQKGYATAALCLAEQTAKQDGCAEMVLFVSDKNTPAIRLYEKYGYQFLRPQNYGKYMVKNLFKTGEKP